MRRVSNQTWDRLKHEAAAELHDFRPASRSQITDQARPPRSDETSTDSLEISRVLRNLFHRRGA